MTDKQKIDNEYWKNKYADIHIRLTNKIAELQEQLKRKEQECERLKKEVKKWKKFLDGGICDCETKAKSEQKLEKIKDRCNETLELMNKDSGTNAYAGGRCIEAENILQIIDEVE